STSTPSVEVANVSPHGIWLWVEGRVFRLSFEQFPWFREATISQIYRVELHHARHLHWPDLDIDLELDSLAHPEKFPLVSRS
ncbi:MAG: DUF2442 domain-containing protein, partial [Myxococcota bacterium]